MQHGASRSPAAGGACADTLSPQYDEFQRMEEERIEFAKQTLKKFVAAQEDLVPLLQQGTQMTSKLVNSVDKSHDIDLFIADARTGNDRPVPDEFVKYNRRTPDGSVGAADPSAAVSPKRGRGGGNNASASKLGPTPSKAVKSPFLAKGKRNVETATALYDFPGEEEGELGFSEGDTLEIIEKDDGWWLAKNSAGKTGQVPENYVELN